ncbi:hypothetical protein [Thalassotalea agarivorans]|uniref:Uncharacterized protein n=1 Tax=Thalassotalea agarivorans TaxID=349064 RepID=A0A1H9ZU89_THASX|nr:hypothetical protein [Thalassotalea agarivorans]SES85294.1 hypothetical protein SAMN05660429_00590 [Thalassotalea agarivorans]
MTVIKWILYLAALITIIYPLRGIADPQSYLPELIEMFPSATGASDSQVRLAVLISYFSQIIVAALLFFLAQFIAQPNKLHARQASGMVVNSVPIYSKYHRGVYVIRAIQSPQ